MFASLVLVLFIGSTSGILITSLCALLWRKPSGARTRTIRKVSLIGVFFLSCVMAGTLANKVFGPDIGLHAFETAADVKVGRLRLPSSARKITLWIRHDAEYIKFQTEKSAMIKWLEDINNFGQLDDVSNNHVIEQACLVNDSTFYSLFKETGWPQARDLSVFNGQPSMLHAWYDPADKFAYVCLVRW